MIERTPQKRRRLEAEHDRSEDGRRAHPVSNAPYGTETHLNEEQAKRKNIDKVIERGEDAANRAPHPGSHAQKPANGIQDAPNYQERDKDSGAISEESLNSANDE